MKVPIKNKVKKQKIKKKPKEKTNAKEQVLVVAQEFKFARLLSGNEKKTRDRVLKTLKKWFQNCFDKGYEFKEDDFIRVWKGLFYAVWMSDKPLVQEDLCESIAEILDLFPSDKLEHAVLMTKAGLKVLATEWYGIDQHRMDKFLMLVRRYLRGSLRCLKKSDWSIQSCQEYSNMLMSSDGILAVKTPQYARNAMSMILHVTDCFLEELAKVSNGTIPEASLAVLLQPFTALVCGGEALALCVAARRLLTALMRQSDKGLEYEAASRAWQKMGCPAGGPEALEPVMSDDEGSGDDEEIADEPPSALDPRAGRVDVLLPQLPVPATLLAEQLKTLMAKASSKAYKRASICLQRFEALSKDEYPLVVPETEASGAEAPLPGAEPARAAKRLRVLEKTLVAQSDELALRGLKRKHRKRLLAKSRAGLSIIEEVVPVSDSSANSTNGDWQVEESQPKQESKSKKATDSSNKENEVVKKKASRKRKAAENGLEKVKKAKSINNIADKSKVSDKSELKNNKGPDKKLDLDKSKNIVNGISSDEKSNNKKEKKIKAVKSEVKEKPKGQEKVVKNAPKLIEINSQTDQSKATEAKSVINGTDEGRKNILRTKQEKTELTRGPKVTAVDKKLVKRQKVLPMGKIKNYQKQTSRDKEMSRKKVVETPKKVKFVLKNNGMQGTIDYYKSVRQSPNIPFDSSKKPSKTNLKVSAPSPINPFIKKKLKMKF